MATPRSKLLVGLVSSAVGAAVAVIVAHRPHQVAALELRRLDTSLLAGTNVASGPGEGVQPLESGEAARYPGSSFRRRPLSDKEVVTLLRFQPSDDLDQIDPYCYYRPRAHCLRTVEWPEHPAGSWIFRTNGAGLRDDLEVESERADLCMLVIGDSHTDGVCSNAENFVHLTENALAARFPGTTVRAHNASRGGYSFFHYLGALEERLALAPDVAVMNVYGGNDFEEALTLYHFFQGTTRPPGHDDYWEEATAAAKVSTNGWGQAFTALKYFSHQPDQIEVALQCARDVFTEFHVTCLRAGVRPVVMYLPSFVDGQRTIYQVRIDKLRKAVHLSDEDMQITDRMATSFLDFVRVSGVQVVDLRPAFRASKEKLFWETDFHLDLAGHRLAAEQLTAALAASNPPTAKHVRRASGVIADRDARFLSPGNPDAVAGPNLAAPPPVAESVDAPTPAVAPALAPDMHALVFGEPVAVTKGAGASADFKPRPVRESDSAAWSSVWPQVEFDAERHLRWKPGLDLDVTGGDAPDASWRLHTAGSGLRREREPAASFDGARVLFCGDELVAGGCAPEQALAAAAEQRLTSSLAGLAVECLDASTPGHFLDAYLAVFEHYAPLAPLACVVVVNGGNDFLEGLPRLATARRKAADAATPAELEFLDSLTRFANHPRDATLALRQAVDSAAALATRCRALHCEPVFVYVPPASDVPAPGARATAFAEAKLDQAAWSAIDRLGTAWIAELRSRGLRVADLRPLLREAAESSYGASRHLLTRSAHDAVAEVLAPELARILAPSAAIEASSAPGNGGR